MKKVFFPLLLISVAILANCSTTRLDLANQPLVSSDPEMLAESSLTRLKKRQFDEIYNSSSTFFRNNISREGFVRRATLTIDELEKIDKDVSWRDDEIQKHLFSLREEDEETKFVAAHKILADDKGKIYVSLIWRETGEARN